MECLTAKMLAVVDVDVIIFNSININTLFSCYRKYSRPTREGAALVSGRVRTKIVGKQNRRSRRGREPSLTARHTVRLSVDELALIDAVRDRFREIFPLRRISRSEVIRAMISETGDALAEHLASAPTVVDQSDAVEKFAETIELLQGVDGQLQRLGNNVNQVVRNMNFGLFTREDVAAFRGLQDEIGKVRVSLDRVQADVYGRDPYGIIRKHSWLS